MNKLTDALINLLNVKSIVTLVLTGVFAWLSIGHYIGQDLFMTVYTVLISFYFGTQYQRARAEAAAAVKAEQEEAAEK